MDIPLGLCQCGCGQKTKIAKETDPQWKTQRGKPRRFCRGHNHKASHPKSWNGGKKTDSRGYPKTLIGDHPRADQGGYVFDHVLAAEKALGKALPPEAQVHHFPDIKDWEHLIICENQFYHNILEVRYRALKTCGKVNWKKCRYCNQWDDPKNMFAEKRDVHQKFFHRSCHAEYGRNRRASLRLRSNLILNL
jgi:hypothetical protein